MGGLFSWFDTDHMVYVWNKIDLGLYKTKYYWKNMILKSGLLPTYFSLYFSATLRPETTGAESFFYDLLFMNFF